MCDDDDDDYHILIYTQSQLTNSIYCFKEIKKTSLFHSNF